MTISVKTTEGRSFAKGDTVEVKDGRVGTVKWLVTIQPEGRRRALIRFHPSKKRDPYHGQPYEQYHDVAVLRAAGDGL